MVHGGAHAVLLHSLALYLALGTGTRLVSMLGGTSSWLVNTKFGHGGDRLLGSVYCNDIEYSEGESQGLPVARVHCHAMLVRGKSLS